MNKLIALGAAVLAAVAGTAANADGGKTFLSRPGGGRWWPCAPGLRCSGARFARLGHGYWRPGYWHSGRWIAPVFVAAAIGGIAYAATAPVYAAPTVAPMSLRRHRSLMATPARWR